MAGTGLTFLQAASDRRLNAARGADQGTPDTTAAGIASAAELLRAVVDASPFATMAFDRDRKVIFWSVAAERIFGWRADEMLGRPFPVEAIPPEDRASSAERIRRPPS